MLTAAFEVCSSILQNIRPMHVMHIMRKDLHILFC